MDRAVAWGGTSEDDDVEDDEELQAGTLPFVALSGISTEFIFPVMVPGNRS